MKNKITNVIVYLTCGILLIVGPYTLFRVCETSDMIMKCFWATKAVNAVGGLISFFGIVSLLVKSKDAVLAVNLCGAAAGITAILIPSILIGGCTMNTMACQVLTFPAIYFISIVVILFSIGNLVYLKKGKGKR